MGCPDWLLCEIQDGTCCETGEDLFITSVSGENIWLFSSLITLPLDTLSRLIWSCTSCPSLLMNHTSSSLNGEMCVVLTYLEFLRHLWMMSDSVCYFLLKVQVLAVLFSFATHLLTLMRTDYKISIIYKALALRLVDVHIYVIEQPSPVQLYSPSYISCRLPMI